MSSTDIASFAYEIECPIIGYTAPTIAMSDTGIASVDGMFYATCRTDIPFVAGTHYAMSGTDIASSTARAVTNIAYYSASSKTPLSSQRRRRRRGRGKQLVKLSH
eukprot:3513880-Rhodomonas_salina.3